MEIQKYTGPSFFAQFLNHCVLLQVASLLALQLL